MPAPSLLPCVAAKRAFARPALAGRAFSWVIGGLHVSSIGGKPVKAKRTAGARYTDEGNK